MEKELLKIKERLDFIEFRQDLLFYNSEVDRLLYEYRINESQYKSIMDLMDEFRIKFKNTKEIDHCEFENKMSKLLKNIKNIDYHFCEDIARAFMSQGRWEEIFPALYGDMPKYKNNKEC